MTSSIDSPARAFRGPLGTITELPLDPATVREPQQAATLQHWFLDAPPAHPLWPHYILFTCHLRDVPGQTQPPVKPRPSCSHNLMLVALDPQFGPWSAENVVTKMLAEVDRGRSAHLMPLNWSEFIDDATDGQAKELTALVARGLVDGYVPIEPQDFYGGHAAVKRAIALTIEHIVHLGHPFRGEG